MKEKRRTGKGSLRRKTVLLVVTILLATLAVAHLSAGYRNKILLTVVDETKTEQQQAISEASQSMMHNTLANALSEIVSLQAQMADDDFAEVISQVRTLATMTEGIFENREIFTPLPVSLPDPAKQGALSAMALFEDGVDYARSEYLGYAANLASPMIAMMQNAEKIDGVFIGFEDGTDLCVDASPMSKLDENGNLRPFPVRERPWYRGAVAAGGVSFTGIEPDAFTGKLLVTCSAPVYANGALIGVVGVDIRLENMNGFMETTAQSAGTAFVINERGQAILSSKPDGLFAVTSSDAAPDLRTVEGGALKDFLCDALSARTKLYALSIDGREYYALGAPMPTIGWAVAMLVEKDVTERSERMLLSEYDRINETATDRFLTMTSESNRTGWLILLLLVVLSVCAALYAAGSIARPIEEMTDGIVKSGNTGEPFEMKDSYRTRDEIQVLAESFDDLSQRTAQYIRDITAITKEKERVNTELSMASRIQSSMLPHVFPAFPDRTEFEIYAAMDPAKEVGGDFYDFFLIDDDHLCMTIADVSGKGVPAALFMMVSKALLKGNAKAGKSAADILTLTNETICSNNTMQMFVTVWIGILEISTGKVTAANAGHEYPAIAQGGQFTLLRDKHGFVIGGMEGVRYRSYELQLNPGDCLFVYTDGVPEASDAENNCFGVDRMLLALNRAPDACPEALLKNVRADVDAFVKDAEQFDDLTMLCLRYNGPKR